MTSDSPLIRVQENWGRPRAIINPFFGKPIAATTAGEGVLTGWNNRRANWQTSVAIQREVTDVLSVEVAWFRRSNINFQVIDNLNIGPEHFSEFSITAPVDAALGDVSGTTLTGLYTITPEGAELGTNNLITNASDYGKAVEIFNGVDISFQGRFENGINIGGGMATGAVEINECYVVDNPTQGRPGYCNFAPGWGDGTQVKFNGLVPLPYDVDFSFVFQSLPGVIRRSNYRAGADPMERASIEEQIGHDMVTGFEEIPLFPSGIGFYEEQPSPSLPYLGFTFLDNSTQYEPQFYQLGPAADEDADDRRRAHPPRLRRLQHLQRERHHPEPRRLLDRGTISNANGRDGRPADQVRNDHGLLNVANDNNQGRGTRPPPFFSRAPVLR